MNTVDGSQTEAKQIAYCEAVDVREAEVDDRDVRREHVHHGECRCTDVSSATA